MSSTCDSRVHWRIIQSGHGSGHKEWREGKWLQGSPWGIRSNHAPHRAGPACTFVLVCRPHLDSVLRPVRGAAAVSAEVLAVALAAAAVLVLGPSSGARDAAGVAAPAREDSPRTPCERPRSGLELAAIASAGTGLTVAHQRRATRSAWSSLAFPRLLSRPRCRGLRLLHAAVRWARVAAGRA